MSVLCVTSFYLFAIQAIIFYFLQISGEVVRLLETDGDFLVRETVRNDEKQIVLSVRILYSFLYSYDRQILTCTAINIPPNIRLCGALQSILLSKHLLKDYSDLKDLHLSLFKN